MVMIGTGTTGGAEADEIMLEDAIESDVVI